MARLNYVEMTVGDVAVTKAFYEGAFGWTMTRFGPSYAATTTGDTDVGLQGDAAEARTVPLPVIDVDDLDAAEQAVVAAGGVIVVPAFDFPGGRRFHFTDPAGNEMAVVKAA
jgi:predicted enzyme related to lactoylglutathione lyase